jgi:DNA-binding beta-propeller fold protein YncE
MMRWIVAIAARAAIGGCGPRQPEKAEAPPTAETAAPAQGQFRLEQIWRLEGLANPESVALSADGTFLYVTNVNGQPAARDGNGFISRVGVDGRMLEREWMGGFNAPKGVARAGDTLYVADVDTLHIVDTATKTRSSVRAPGARFLNDVAVAPDGLVLAADSQTQRIYALRNRSMSPWKEGVLLESVNGLWPEPERLVVTTMAGRLLAIDYGSKEITVLAEGLANADGVAPLGGGEYLVSDWPGRLFRVRADGSHEVVLDTTASRILLNDFLLVGDILYQPNLEPSTLTAYRVIR